MKALIVTKKCDVSVAKIKDYHTLNQFTIFRSRDGWEVVSPGCGQGQRWIKDYNTFNFQFPIFRSRNGWEGASHLSVAKIKNYHTFNQFPIFWSRNGWEVVSPVRGPGSNIITLLNFNFQFLGVEMD